MASYLGIGNVSKPNHSLEVQGQYFQDKVERGVGTTYVPFEIFSNYSNSNDVNLHPSRQLRLRVHTLNDIALYDGHRIFSCDMGIDYTGSHFFITKPTPDADRGYLRAFMIDNNGNVGININVDPTLDDEGKRIGMDVSNGLPNTLYINGSVRMGSLNVPSLTTQQLNSDQINCDDIVVDKSFTITPAEGDTAIDIPLGEGKVFSVPSQFIGAISNNVSSVLGYESGLSAVLTLGNIAPDQGIDVKFVNGVDFVKTQGYLEASTHLEVGSHASIGGPHDPTKGLVIRSTGAQARPHLMLYDTESAVANGIQEWSIDSQGKLLLSPGRLADLNTHSLQIGTSDLRQRRIDFWTTEFGIYDNLPGSGTTLKIVNRDSAYNPANPAVMEFNGRIGINESAPDYDLHVNGATSASTLGSAFYHDLDRHIFVGRAALGGSTIHNDYAWFSHLDQKDSGTGYALIQNSAGTTHVNAPTGQTVTFRIQNVDQARVVDGGLRMPNGKSIVFDQTGAGIEQNYGTYGSVQTVSSGGGWSGYACAGGYQGGSRHVFMSSGYATGIYGESAAEWFIYCRDNGGVDLRYNDGVKLETLTDGVNIYGNHNTTGAIRQGGADVINGNKTFVGTGGVDTTGAVTADQNITTPMDMSCRDLTASRNIKAVNAIGIVQDPFAKLTIGSTASGFGNIDEIAFRSVNNDANSRSGYSQRIGFYGKEQYSSGNSLDACIDCRYGTNVHYPTWPGHSSTKLVMSTRNDYGVYEEKLVVDGYWAATGYNIPFIPSTFVGFTAYNDESPSHNDFNTYNPIVMDRTQHNFQSMYDVNNGIFVVPYTGNYYVSFTVWNDDGFAGFGLLDDSGPFNSWSLYKMGTYSYNPFGSSNSTGLQSTVSNGEAHTYAGICYLKVSRQYAFGWVSGNDPRYTSEAQTRCSVFLVSSLNP